MKKTIFALFSALVVVACTSSSPVKVMSYNIRYGTADDASTAGPTARTPPRR